MSVGEIDALSLIELCSNFQSNKKFKEIDKFFPYTNEDIRKYSSIFEVQNKSVLTVCGSGDQVFNSIVLGAKDITTFDINIVALYHLELKKAIIEHFNIKDFITFYKSGMKDTMYKKVRENLSKECLTFWDKMYTNDKTMLKYFWGTISESYSDYFEYFNPYLDKDKYELLQDELKTFKIKIIQSDMLELKNKLTQKYDLMNFSNILNALRYTMKDSELSRDIVKSYEWYSEIINKYFINNLNNNGQILVNYFFSPYAYCESIKMKLQVFFKQNPSFSIHEFTTCDSFGYDTDQHLLMYRRTSKN